MSRLILLVLISVVCFPFFASAQTEGCPYGGDWHITYSLTFQYGSTVVEGSATWTENGDMQVSATCSGGAVTFTGSGTGDINVINTLMNVCAGEFTANIDGTITESSPGLPIFHVNFNPLTYINGDCGEGGQRTLNLITNLNPVAGYYDGELITNFILADVIPDEEVIEEIYIIVAEREVNASLEQVSPQYTRYFIRDVPLSNLYTFQINWDTIDQPSAEISVHGGDWEAMNVSGNQATYTVQITEIPVSAADFALTKLINVTMDIRFPSANQPPISLGPDQIRMTLVDAPTWAAPADFKVDTTTASGNVIYRYTEKIPEQPLETPILTIPDFIPIIGGSWGLEPVQMTVNAGVHSLGTPHSEAITGTGKLHFAGEMYAVQIEGDLWTDIDDNGIQVLESPFTISLDKPIQVMDNISVVSLAPVFAGLLNTPVIGDVIEGFFSLVTFDLQFTGNVSGSGKIGVLPSGDLGITEGTLDLNVDSTIGFSVNVVDAAWLGLHGTVGAHVAFDLANSGEIKQCEFQMGITVTAGAIELGTSTPVQLFTQIPVCNP